MVPEEELRFVLDSMTNEFKRQEIEKHLKMVIKTALDPTDFDGKVEIIKELMTFLQVYLPPEIRAQPPERYAVRYEELIRAFLSSKEKIERMFRTL